MRFFDTIPNTDWLVAGGFLASLVAFLAGVEWLSRKFSPNSETVRKVVHFASGLAVLPTPFLFRTFWPMLLIALLFAAANAWSIRSGQIGVYNRSERRSLGTVFYPISLAVLLPIFWQEHPALLLIPFALMAFGDPVAGLVGARASRPLPFAPPWDRKSLRGSVAMFVTSTGLVALGLSLAGQAFALTPAQLALTAIAVGAVAAAAEALSYRGSDNLSVPLISAAMLKLLLSPGLFQQALLGELLAAGIVVVAWRLRALDLSGGIAAFWVGTFIFGAGGWAWSLPLIVFFVSSSLLSKWAHRRKVADGSRFKAVSHRDAKQVLANGGLPMLLAILSIWFPHPVLFLLFVAAVAAAAADTWATEIGLLSGHTPRSVVTGKPVLPGTSGGITFPGLAGAAAGSGLVVLSVLLAPAGAPGTAVDGPVLGWLALAGFLAHLLDSLLGATLQRKAACTICGQETEHLQHCDAPTRHVAGLRWLDNDGVNLACSLGGMLIAAALV